MKQHRAVTMLVATALAAAIAVPVAAYALPGRGRLGAPAGSSDATKQARFQQRRELLKQRVTSALQKRTARFDTIAARLLQRIGRVSAIADKVEAKGGDVSSVRASLATATSQVEQAKAAQAKAATLFAAVPDASDKKVAFDAARTQAKVAVQTLKQARVTLRNGILNLRAIVNGLKAAGQ